MRMQLQDLRSVTITAAIGTVLVLGSVTGVTDAAGASAASAPHVAPAAVSAAADDGVTVGRALFAGVGVAGLGVLVAALRGPTSRRAHRARRRRIRASEPPR